MRSEDLKFEKNSLMKRSMSSFKNLTEKKSSKKRKDMDTAMT